MAELLKKIVVKNVGVLKAFNTPNSPQFEQLTSFYARNGRGKTTLSSILRSASANDSTAIRGRQTLGLDAGGPDVTLVFETGSVRFEQGRWQTPIDRIDVFDGAFIAENLYAGETIELTHDRGLFTVILGRPGVKLAKQQEFFVAAAKRSAQRLKEAEAALVDDLPTDLSREEFFAYSPAPDLDARTEQAEKDLKGVLQADRLAKLRKLETITISDLDPSVSEVLARTIANIEASARERLAAHFKKFELGKQGEDWLKFGLDHVRDDKCPFCGKPDVGETGLTTVYGQIFGDAYKAHFDSIRAIADEIEKSFGAEARASISVTSATNTESVASWAEFYALENSQLPTVDGAVAKLAEAHEALKTLFDAKRLSPLTPISEDTTIAAIAQRLADAKAAVAIYNQAVSDLDSLIEKKKLQGVLTEAQARERLSNLKKRKQRNDAGTLKRIAAVLSAKRRDARAKRIRTDVQNRLKEKNEEGAKHYHARVNHYLERFGAKFRISPFTNSMAGNAGSVDYGLIVRGHSVSRGRGRDKRDEPTFMNTLSTGDKTTLAFAFFLADLDRHDGALKERIIVFDDPLSSHDSHRQGKTVDLLFELSGRCAQVVVLSHDAFFLRRLHRRCNKSTKIAYQIEFEGPEDWSVAAAADLNELCQSDHAQRLKKLLAYYTDRTGSPSDVAPAVRTVLETHYRSAYPAYFGPNANLGGIVQDIKDSSHPCWEDRADLDSCNVHTLDQHHGDDPQTPANEPIDPDELHGIVKTCLLLVHAIVPSESLTEAA